MPDLVAATVVTTTGRLALVALAVWAAFRADRVAAALTRAKRRGTVPNYLPGERWQELWTTWGLRLFFGVVAAYLLLVVVGVVPDAEQS